MAAFTKKSIQFNFMTIIIGKRTENIYQISVIAFFNDHQSKLDDNLCPKNEKKRKQNKS